MRDYDDDRPRRRDRRRIPVATLVPDKPKRVPVLTLAAIALGAIVAVPLLGCFVLGFILPSRPAAKPSQDAQAKREDPAPVNRAEAPLPPKEKELAPNKEAVKPEPNQPATLPTIKLSDLRQHRKEYVDREYRLKGRARYYKAFDGAMLVFMTADPNQAEGIALLPARRIGQLDPAVYDLYEVDVVIEGKVTSFEGGVFDQECYGFAFEIEKVVFAQALTRITPGPIERKIPGSAQGAKGGPVNVKGYTKSNGTMVQPYTRNPPRSGRR